MLDNFINFLERDAGHICVALALITMCAAWHFPKSEDVLLIAVGVLGRCMNGVAKKE